MTLKSAAGYFGIFLGVVFLFLLFHNLLQDQENYERSVGRFMLNYVREGTWSEPDIYKDTVAYLAITEDNISAWDAAIYNCIRQHGYQAGHQCYDDFKSAFLPGFPLLWRASFLGFRGISVLNYLLYALSLALLISYFQFPQSWRYWLFALLLCFPDAIIYAIPYSEALFTLSGTLAALAYIKNQKILFTLAFAALMLTRVASLFVLLAVVLMALLLFAYRGKKHGNNSLWLWLAMGASVLAYLVYFSMLWQAGREPWEYLTATNIGEAFLRWPQNFRDWSHESFGMSSVATFTVLLPAFVFSCWHIFQKKKILANSSRQRQVFTVSGFYLAGIFLFTLLHSGGSLHSLHRFTFCSPAFLFVLFYSIKKRPFPLWTTPVFGLLATYAFWYFVPYAGHEFKPELLGIFLIPLFLVSMVSLRPQRSWPFRIYLGLLLLVGIWWATYLHNQLLSNAWIFT